MGSTWLPPPAFLGASLNHPNLYLCTPGIQGWTQALPCVALSTGRNSVLLGWAPKTMRPLPMDPKASSPACSPGLTQDS